MVSLQKGTFCSKDIKASFENIHDFLNAAVRVPKRLGTQPWHNVVHQASFVYGTPSHDGHCSAMAHRQPKATGQLKHFMCTLCSTGDDKMVDGLREMVLSAMLDTRLLPH
eukprot:gnl/TRDRNA2_/TRDRNA2_139928_c1_seq1.p2 gnl/TRDRNA2_/TRDRNA2_139928_c1~~gnl/TRDRNA2_/TRDRNA2_139928_c1_seq1.p2  ORF type:complete len:110 (-),score=14.23 gnl/TRDRNA2_/TRDRNA2_139928_c1_seq1:39-368(-)